MLIKCYKIVYLEYFGVMFDVFIINLSYFIFVVGGEFLVLVMFLFLLFIIFFLMMR